MAWCGNGERLALALGGAHPASGCIALYATSYTPVLSARFVGYMRGPSGACGDDSGTCEADSSCRRANKALPVALAFQSRLPHGSLLAVRRGGELVSMYPLYHTPHH